MSDQSISNDSWLIITLLTKILSLKLLNKIFKRRTLGPWAALEAEATQNGKLLKLNKSY